MSRSRITISIDKDLVKEIDRRIDGMHIRNRSHAIETLLSESLSLSTIKTAVILAGGDKAVKKVPAIIHSLAVLRKFGIFKVIIAVGYLGNEIKDQIEQTDIRGQKIEYHRSGNGTGGSLYELKTKLKKAFFVVNVDKETDANLKNLIRFHNEHKPIATIATHSLRDLNGFYIFEPNVFDYIPRGFSSLEDDVFVKLTKEGKLLSYPVLD